MHLDVVIEDKTHRVEIPDGMLTEAEDFFQKMDRDMDHGWQMGPEFIEQPDRMQRCQIAANKLLTSISGENQLLSHLMAAYILKRQPGVQRVNIDTFGEMLHTEFFFQVDDKLYSSESKGSIDKKQSSSRYGKSTVDTQEYGTTKDFLKTLINGKRVVVKVKLLGGEYLDGLFPDWGPATIRSGLADFYQQAF